MKEIALPVAELKPALIGLGKIVGRARTLPVLGYLKLERDATGAISLAANNLDQAAIVTLGTRDAHASSEPATMLVPLDRLSETAKRCGNDDTIIIRSTGRAPLSSGSIEYPVSAATAEQSFDEIPPEEFPALPEIVEPAAPVPDELKRSLLEALQCASTDETRYILNGAYLDVSKPECHQVVGTNGRILYSSNSFSLSLPASMVIPASRFLRWNGFVDDGEWAISVGPSVKEGLPHFRISSRRWQYFSKQIEGNYPNYRQVIPGPNQAKTSVVFDPAGIESVIQTIERLPCHDNVHHTIGVQVQGSAVSLLGKSAAGERWTAVKIPTLKAQGPDVLIAFDRLYLTQALRFGLNTVQIINSMSPARFSTGGRLMVVMPVRVDAPPAHNFRAPAPAPQRMCGAEAESTGSAAQPKPASAESSPEAPTTERNKPMKASIETPSNSDGASSNGPTPPEQPSPLTTALAQIELIKGSYREAIAGLNSLAELLKQTAREQKASQKEILSVRQTLRSLQSVRI